MAEEVLSTVQKINGGNPLQHVSGWLIIQSSDSVHLN